MTRTRCKHLLVCFLVMIAEFRKANGCTLCASVKLVSTFREDFANPWVNVITSGRLGKATLSPDGAGLTEFTVGQVFRKPKGWADAQVLAFDKYLPGGEKGPDSVTVLLGNWEKNRLVPMRAIRLESFKSLPVIQNQVAQKSTPDARFLVEIFPRLILREPELASDAFMEWAKAEDNLVAAAARKLPPDLVRGLLQEQANPSERLGLLSFLLGCCGSLDRDSAFLDQALQSKDPRWRNARDGLLAGLVLLNPTLGWKRALESLSSPMRPLTERLATLRALKMLHSTGLKEYRELESVEMVETVEKALGQKDLADIAIDYLRSWKQSRLENQVLSSFPAKGEGPLLSRSILQYAISFRERPTCAAFLEKVKKDQPELVQEIEQIYGHSP